MEYFVGAFLEMIKFYLFFKYGGKIQVREKKHICTILSIFLWLLYSYLCWKNGGEELLLYLFWAILEVSIIFKYQIVKLVALAIGAMTLIGMLDGLSVMGIELAHIILRINIGKQTGNLLADVVTLIFFLILYEFILKKGDITFRDIGIIRLLYIFVIGLLYTLILAIIWNEVGGWEMQEVQMKVYVIFFLIVGSAYYQIAILLALAVSNQNLKSKNMKNRYYLELQEKQYIYLRDTEQKTKKIRHDMKQHIFIVFQLCQTGDIEKVKEYIIKIWGKLEEISTDCYANNNIVDAILNQYVALCKKAGIQFTIKGYLPSECKLDSYDICTLFSNILQNAYEATILCETRKINLVLRHDEKNIYIQQCNTYSGTILVEDGKIQTNKKNKLWHGFGMENIENCIRRYKGTLEFSEMDFEKEKLIVIQIMLCNKTPKGEQ
ncbi:MAG: GHKL domain-containing protein [Lachnospiraceae bacterium]